jgi:hypothetical protein
LSSSGCSPQRHAAVAAHRVTAVYSDVFNDGQHGVERPAGGDHDLVAGGYYRLRRFTNGRGHVAVVVHQGAVHVQGDHQFLVCVVVFVVSPVIVAGD